MTSRLGTGKSLTFFYSVSSVFKHTCSPRCFYSDVTSVADWHRFFDANTDPDPSFRVMNREQSWAKKLFFAFLRKFLWKVFVRRYTVCVRQKQKFIADWKNSCLWQKMKFVRKNRKKSGNFCGNFRVNKHFWTTLREISYTLRKFPEISYFLRKLQKRHFRFSANRELS